MNCPVIIVIKVRNFGFHDDGEIEAFLSDQIVKILIYFIAIRVMLS